MKKVLRLGVGLLVGSMMAAGLSVPAQAAGTLTIWVNSGEEATFKSASAAWASKNHVTLNVVAKCGLRVVVGKDRLDSATALA